MMRTQTIPPDKAKSAWDVVERNATALKQIKFTRAAARCSCACPE